MHPFPRRWDSATKPVDRLGNIRQMAEESWRTGDLFWRLHSGQRAMIRRKDAAPADIPFVSHIGRQWGKSYGWIGYYDMLCRAIPGARVSYVAATKIAVREIVVPNFGFWWYTKPPGFQLNSLEEVMALQCPEKYKPKHNESTGVIRYHNGSELILVGAENDQIDRARGPFKHGVILDEAGFVKVDLEYFLDQVLEGVYTHTGGSTVLNSTSPRSPMHPFRDYALEADKHGAYFAASSLDNPLLTQKQRDRIIRSITQKNKAKALRARLERFPVWATDPDRAIIPEATPDAGELIFHDDGRIEVPEFSVSIHHERLPWVKQEAIPRWAHRIWTIDPGNDDQNLTGVLGGFYDFERATLVITSEALLERPLTADIERSIQRLWPSPLDQIEGQVEGFSDVDLNLVRDLIDAGIQVAPTAKAGKHAAVNKVRDWFSEGRIEVWPNCKNLITQIVAGTWRKSQQGDLVEFDRIKGMGHCDLIDCMVYMVRNVNEQRNPKPMRANMDQLQINMLESHGVIRKSTGSAGADLWNFLRNQG